MHKVQVWRAEWSEGDAWVNHLLQTRVVVTRGALAVVYRNVCASLGADQFNRC